MNGVSKKARINDDEAKCLRLVTEIGDTDAINDVNRESGRSILIGATLNSWYTVIEKILSYKSTELDIYDDDGVNAFGHACMDRNIDVIHIFIKHNAVNREELNLGLEDAVSCNHWELTKVLLAHGANVNRGFSVDSFNGKTVTHYTDRRMLNYKKHLPLWDRFKTYKYYPKAFNRDVAITWLLCCNHLKVLSKDIRYMIIGYLAEDWKANTGPISPSETEFNEEIPDFVFNVFNIAIWHEMCHHTNKAKILHNDITNYVKKYYYKNMKKQWFCVGDAYRRKGWTVVEKEYSITFSK